ncbi:MAG: phosphatidylserine decarboxylase [Pseudomonadota bacterium]
MLELIKSYLAPIHKSGWPFVAAGLALAVIGGLAWSFLGWLGALGAAWLAYFFRDPERVTPTRPGLVVSPADGRILMIRRVPAPPELGMGKIALARISIFLSIFDVHVNRIPADGVVEAMNYRPGKFVNAAFDKASEDNERMSVRVKLADGRELAVVQIAGLLARRIVCELAPGQAVRAGACYGMIRFGSRVDVYLPEGVEPLVVEGQRAVGGETVLADLASAEGPREGEVR